MATPRFFSKKSQKAFQKAKKNAAKALSLKTFQWAKAKELETTLMPERQAKEALDEVSKKALIANEEMRHVSI